MMCAIEEGTCMLGDELEAHGVHVWCGDGGAVADALGKGREVGGRGGKGRGEGGWEDYCGSDVVV